MRRATLLSAGLAVLALVGCGGADGDASTASTPADGADATASAAAATTTRTTAATAGCTTVAQPRPKRVHERKPSAALRSGATYTVTLRTSCGDLAIRLDQRRQPRTAASFAHLVRDGVYDELTFHRVVPGFVIQGGDPAGDGTGDAGYSVTEAPPKGVAYGRGVVAMAKTQAEAAGTSGSQFFVVTSGDAAAQLTPDYAVVGRVVSGLRTVDRIAAVQTDAQEAPVDPVVIEKATLRAR
jgi:peptidyl-prolyl cis-trans isomerase B (cyclophilin B)